MDLTGYDNVMEKARQMIQGAEKEIYARLFPEADRHLSKDLIKALKKGVAIRYIAMGDIPKRFAVQVTHPDHQNLIKTIGAAPLTLSLTETKPWWAFLKWITKTTPPSTGPGTPGL